MRKPGAWSRGTPGEVNPSPLGTCAFYTQLLTFLTPPAALVNIWIWIAIYVSLSPVSGGPEYVVEVRVRNELNRTDDKGRAPLNRFCSFYNAPATDVVPNTLFWSFFFLSALHCQTLPPASWLWPNMCGFMCHKGVWP